MLTIRSFKYTNLAHTNRSNHQRCSIKNAVLKHFSIFTGPATFLKKDSNKCVFLWILRNLYEHLFEEYLRMAASGLISRMAVKSQLLRHLTSSMVKVFTKYNKHQVCTIGGSRNTNFYSLMICGINDFITMRIIIFEKRYSFKLIWG